jgi:hypothetical protein
MKVKEKSTVKPDPFEDAGKEMNHLGFCGGLKKKEGGKTKRIYEWSTRKRSPLTRVASGSVMRLHVEPGITISAEYTVKTGAAVWQYDSAAQEKEASSSGLHAKLIAALGPKVVSP